MVLKRVDCIGRVQRLCIESVLSLLLLFISGCGSWCLVDGSIVSTPDGPKRVEELEIGDSIYCITPSGEECQGSVTFKKENKVNGFYAVYLEGNPRPLRATGQHLLGANGTWTQTAKLRPGDWVDTASGPQRIKAIKREKTQCNVYDISVAPYPGYFADSLVCHNKSRPNPPKSEDIARKWFGREARGMERFWLLELNPDHTARLAIGNPGKVQVYKSNNWTLDGFEFKAQLSCVSGCNGNTTFNLYGTSQWHKIRLELQGPEINGQEVELQRADDVMQGLDVLGRELASPRGL